MTEYITQIATKLGNHASNATDPVTGDNKRYQDFLLYDRIFTTTIRTIRKPNNAQVTDDRSYVTSISAEDMINRK